jgi:hypothetical protein
MITVQCRFSGVQRMETDSACMSDIQHPPLNRLLLVATGAPLIPKYITRSAAKASANAPGPLFFASGVRRGITVEYPAFMLFS